MRRFLPLLAMLVATAAAMLLGAGPAAAQVGTPGVPVRVCIARATPQITPAQALAGRGAFDCRTRQTAFGPGDFWVVSEALPASLPADQPLGVRTVSVWQRALTLYALYPDGKVVRSIADDHALARSIQLGAVIERRLPDRNLRPVRLAWHVEGSANMRGVVIAPRIATPAQSARSNLAMGALYAAFAGFALALLAHNLAIWRALRQRFQLYYIAMLVMLMGYALSSSGALAWFDLGIANTTRLRINYLTLGLAGASAIGFARHFFELRIFAGWLGRAANLTILTLVVSALSFAIFAPWHVALFDRLFALSFMAATVMVVPMLWRAWRLRSDYRWLFGLAWAAPIVLAGVRVAHTLGQVGWNFWLDNSTLLAMTAEALISSMAIAYRVRTIAHERDEARAQEIAARLLADTDPLTGLLNRRAFLAQAIGRGSGQRLLLLDLDHFKRVNETIGHDGGDEVLRRIARLLRGAAPAGALVTRLGGEEFAILALASAAPDPQALLGRLREMRMPFDLNVTASIGVSDGAVDSDADWKTLYRAADRALFAAKSAGRDRARLAA